MAADSHIGFDLDILDHPRSAIVGLSLVLIFGLDCMYSFGDNCNFYILALGLKLPIQGYFGGLWGHISPK